MKKSTRLLITIFLTILLFGGLNLIFPQKIYVYGAECTSPPKFSWGSFQATVNGNSVVISNSSAYAFKTGRLVQGCGSGPEGTFYHQPSTPSYVRYQMYKDGQLIKDWTDLSHVPGAGWYEQNVYPQTCSYSCNQNTYVINFTLSGLSPGNYSLGLKTGGSAPGTWGALYGSSITFTIAAPPTLSCTLSTIPPGGDEVPSYDVDLKVDVSGTATGTIDYYAKCLSSDAWTSPAVTRTQTSYTFSNLCDYTGIGTKNPRGKVVRQGLTAECTTPFIVVDTTPPTCLIDYLNGWTNSSNIPVTLTQSDSGSGINTSSANIDERHIAKGESWPGWSDYRDGSTANFTYPDPHSDPRCHYHQFRYIIKDNADNSCTANPGYQAKIDTGNPTATIDWSPKAPDASPTSDKTIDITLTESDDCSGIYSGLVQFKTKFLNASESSWGPWQDLQSTTSNFTYTGSDNTCYLFRYRTTDNASNNSTWSDPGTRTCILINQPPDTPILIAPPNNTWINYNPTFQARVSDPDSDNVKAIFEITSWGTLTGSTVPSGGTSSWGPVAIADGDWWWRAKARDAHDAESNWTSYWLMRKDTVLPTAIIDQENGTATDTSIWVNLAESDDRSGVAEGDVDVRISSGSWVNTGLPNGGSTITDFIYTGADGNTYEFRYRVRDNAGNWSNYSYDGSIIISINDPPTITCNDSETLTNPCVDSRNPLLAWNYSDSDGDPQVSYQVQVDADSGFLSPITIDTGIIDSSSKNYQPSGTTLQWGALYYWHVKVKDSYGNWSGWSSNCSFNVLSHAYPSPSFTLSPQKPSAMEPVQFTDQSTCYDDVITGSPCSSPDDSFKWTIPKTQYVDPLVSFGENPIATFSEEGSWDVILEVTDSTPTSFKCSTFKSVKVSSPLPEWKEVIPR